jgi:nucleotide-binding universal stress UspA family protein
LRLNVLAARRAMRATRGPSALGALMRGSVAMKVVQISPVPVTLVK